MTALPRGYVTEFVTEAEVRVLLDRARGVAYGIAKRTGRLHVLDLLAGGATEGLARAVRTFTPDHGVEFTTWAVHLMHNGAWDAFREWHGRFVEGQPYYPRIESASYDLTDADVTDQSGSESRWIVSGSAFDGDPEAQMLLNERARSLLELLGHLTERQRDCLLFKARCEPIRAVAARYGTTETRISQIHKEVRELVRGALAAMERLPLP